MHSSRQALRFQERLVVQLGEIGRTAGSTSGALFVDPEIHAHPQKPWQSLGITAEQIEEIERQQSAVPIIATRLLIDYLMLTCPKEWGPERFRDLRSMIRWQAPAGSMWARRGRIGNLMIWVVPAPGLRLPYVRVRPLLRTDLGRHHSHAVLNELGAFLGAFGPQSAWSVTRLDIAIDYPLFHLDVLAIPHGNVRRRSSIGGEAAFAELTSYFGDRERTYTRIYDRFNKAGQPAMRVERVLRAASSTDRRPLPTSTDRLEDLPNPMNALRLRPVWGEIDAQIAFYIRVAQLYGLSAVPTLLRRVRDDGLAHQIARAVVAAIVDPQSLRQIEQPREAFDRLYAAEAAWVMDAIREERDGHWPLQDRA